MSAVTAPPLTPVVPSRGFDRADIVFEGIEQGGPSFEARVFVNNPAADEATPRTSENGYAGAFHVYGYGASSARMPITKYVVATEAVRAALARSRDLIVTVVAPEPAPPVRFDRVTVVFGR